MSFSSFRFSPLTEDITIFSSSVFSFSSFFLSESSIASDSAVIAVISAAVAAYGYSDANIVTIRPAGSPVWTNAGRMAGIQNSVN